MSMSVAAAASLGRTTASPLSRLVKRGAGKGAAAAPSRGIQRGARADAAIIDGKAIALDVREEVRIKVEEMKAKHGKVPGRGRRTAPAHPISLGQSILHSDRDKTTRQSPPPPLPTPPTSRAVYAPYLARYRAPAVIHWHVIPLAARATRPNNLSGNTIVFGKPVARKHRPIQANPFQSPPPPPRRDFYAPSPARSLASAVTPSIRRTSRDNLTPIATRANGGCVGAWRTSCRMFLEVRAHDSVHIHGSVAATLRRGLAVVLVGARKDSETYVRSKKKAGLTASICSSHFKRTVLSL